MKTVDVVILKGGKTAKEINYLGEKPKRNKDIPEWIKIEKRRRVFKIDYSHLDSFFEKLEKALGGSISHVHMGYTAGLHRKAQLLHTGKIKIL